MGQTPRKKIAQARKGSTNRPALEKLIEEATVDAYNESEQETGFLTMFEEHVVTPFRARVVGEDVEVRSFDVPDSGIGIVAVVKRQGKTYRVRLVELELGDLAPGGVEWIEAYKLWAKGTG